MTTHNKMLRKIIAIAIALFIVCGNVVKPLSNAIEVNAAGATIFVDGINGSDGNDGTSVGKAVKSWARAKQLLGSNAGTIYVAGTVEAVGNINTANPNNQSVKRASEFTGVMFEVPSGATANFYNIDVDGEDKRIDAEVIKPNPGSTINFLSGAVFHDIGYETEKNPFNYEGGVVVRLCADLKIGINGATFRDNDGKGIFFTALENDRSPITLEMKSGVVRNNKGFFYHNESDNITQNILYIYNALIRNNDASSDYYGEPAAIWLCNQGRGSIRSVEGAAIFDNKQYDLMNLGAESNYAFQGEAMGQDWTHHMLGGGNSQWEQGSVSSGQGAVVYTAHPSDADKAAAIAEATSIFENNQSQVIHTNGTVQFGHYQGAQPVLPTPVIQEEPTPSEEPSPEPSEEPSPEPTPSEEPAPEPSEEPSPEPTPSEEPAPEPTPEEKVVKISKADMDGNEVEGAHIVVKDSDKNIVDEWDSTTKCYEIELLPGTYTLEETVAPEGFKKVETVIEFSVNEEGKVTVKTTEVVNGKVEVKKDGTLVLFDEPEEEPTPSEEPSPEPTPSEEPSPEPSEEPTPSERPTTPETPDNDNPSTPDTPNTDRPSTPTTPDNSTTTTRSVVNTSDNSSTALYAGMLVASLGIATVIILKRKETNE